MSNKLLIMTLMLVAGFAGACTSTETSNANTANANANANATVNTTAKAANESSTRLGPDNSEITTSVDANGNKVETRVFHNNPRIARVVVTTKDGKRTAKAYSPSGEEREIKDNEIEDALNGTGEKVADAAHFVASKTEDAAGTAKEKTEKVGEKTVDTAKDVGEKTKDTTKKVGEGAKEGTKTVVKGAETGVKKTGNAVKKVIP